MERNVRNKNNNDEKEQFKKKCDCHKPKGLHHFKCVPQHLQFNKYVLEGYRMNLSTWECIKSLFYWHNETFNIYSHGLAALTLLLISPYVYSKVAMLQSDPYLYPIHHVTCISCFLLSAVYHLMMCHKGGQKAYTCFILLDYVGIWLVTALCCITFVKATFFCFHLLQWPFVVAYLTMTIVSFVLITKGSDAKSRLKPLIMLGMIRLFCLYPIRLLMVFLGYKTGPLTTLYYMLANEMVGLVGALLNVSRLPEKYIQGRFDYCFNSHNIMHLIVLIAPPILHLATILDLEWMLETECAL